MRSQSHPVRILPLAGISAVEGVIAGGFLAILLLAAATEVYAENVYLLDDLRSSLAATTQAVGDFLDTRFVTVTVTILFWALIGLVTYSLLWSTFIFFADLKNDIAVSERFVHPRSFHKSGFWLAALSRRIILLTAYVLIIAYIYLLLRSMPYVYESLKVLLRNDVSLLPLNSLQSILAFGTWLLGWHVIAVVRRYSIVLSKEI